MHILEYDEMAEKEIFTIEDARGAVLSKSGTKSVRIKVPVGVPVVGVKVAGGVISQPILPGYILERTNESKVAGRFEADIEAIKVDIDSINVAFSQAMKKHA